MSDLNRPNKETVRITLPVHAAPQPTDTGSERDTVRINLPARPPAQGSEPAPVVDPPGRVMPSFPPPSQRASSTPATDTPQAPRVRAASFSPPSPPMPPRPRVLPPPPRVIPPDAVISSVSTAPANYPGSETQAGPHKETARITILPEPTATPGPAVRAAKTQPLLTRPGLRTQSAPVSVAAVPKKNARLVLALMDAVPLPICWTIVVLSAVALLIQIWDYFGS